MTNENIADSQWRASRGDQWLAQLTGMEATLAPVDEPLIRALQVETPSRIAEVGCGGGGTTLEILRRAPVGSLVHGFDISPSLVEAARRRARPEQTGVAFEVADMATAEPDEAYDRLASRFGVMFFDAADAAFANLARWLAPGGRFAFAVWGPPEENPWMTRVRDVVAGLAEVPRSDPDGPGPFRYADPDRLSALLERAGFSELHVSDWRGALPIGGALPPGEAAQFALTAFSSFGEVLARAGDEAVGEARRSLASVFSEHYVGGAVRMDACVRIVTGTRR